MQNQHKLNIYNINLSYKHNCKIISMILFIFTVKIMEIAFRRTLYNIYLNFLVYRIISYILLLYFILYLTYICIENKYTPERHFLQ